MSHFKILLQNIGRSSVGSVKKGGDIATIRLSVHKAKPSIIVLTEIAEQTNLQGKNGHFRGFQKLSMHPTCLYRHPKRCSGCLYTLKWA